MKRILLITIVSLLGLFQKLECQENPVIFSGHLEEASFTEFAESVKAQTDVTFYYRESWVQDIRVTLSGSELSLLSTLDSILQPFELCYFLDEWNHLFLTDTIRLLTGLPEYVTSTEPEISGNREPGIQSVPKDKQHYINGRKVLVPETKHVGSQAFVTPGKRVLINGRITDRESGEPLIGATLYIGEINKGTSTNSDGFFHLIILPGTYEVECNSLGMEPLLFTLIVHSDGYMSLTMKSTLIPLDEVMIRANRYQNVRGTQMGFERLKYSIFKEVPLIMGERDLVNVVKMLPGVQSIGEGASGFNVRGSGDRKSTRLNSSHIPLSRMPSSA